MKYTQTDFDALDLKIKAARRTLNEAKQNNESQERIDYLKIQLEHLEHKLRNARAGVYDT